MNCSATALLTWTRTGVAAAGSRSSQSIDFYILTIIVPTQ